MILAQAPIQTETDWSVVAGYLGWFDMVFLLALLVGMFFGLRKGLGHVLQWIVILTTAQTVSIEFSESFANLAHANVPIPVPALHIIVFFLLAVCSVIAVYFLFVILSVILTVQFKSALNWLGGFTFGGVLSVLSLSLIASFLILFPVPLIQTVLTEGSITGPRLVQTANQIHDVLVLWIPKNDRPASGSNQPAAQNP